MNAEFPENKFINFIKSNTKIFIYIISILLLIIALAFWFFYDSKKDKIEISENFIKAKILLESQNEKDATTILKEIVKKKNTIYSSLSLFLLIDENLIEDKKIILDYFDMVISSNSYSEEDINLLKLKKAIYISDIQEEQEMLKLLNPIIKSNSVWKIQSLRFLGDFYYSISQFKKAKQYYSILLEEEDNQISKAEINRKIDSINNE
tara:strand:- start:19 stop:639 length:621 start_codon:yes stop_codon:yes gene_type:complete